MGPSTNPRGKAEQQQHEKQEEEVGEKSLKQKRVLAGSKSLDTDVMPTINVIDDLKDANRSNKREPSKNPNPETGTITKAVNVAVTDPNNNNNNSTPANKNIVKTEDISLGLNEKFTSSQ